MTIDELHTLTERTLKAFLIQKTKLTLQKDTLGRTVIFQARCDRDDMRRIIGIQGNNVRAVQTLVKLAGEKIGSNVKYEVLEPVTGVEGKNAPLVLKDVWDAGPTKQIVEQWLNAVTEYPFEVKIIDGKSYNSVCEVYLSKDEQIELSTALKEWMGTIITAIGKVNGRRLTMDVVKL